MGLPDHVAGDEMADGAVAIKFSPGIHENQNDPIAVEPVSWSVSEYRQSLGPSCCGIKIADALSAPIARACHTAPANPTRNNAALLLPIIVSPISAQAERRSSPF